MTHATSRVLGTHPVTNRERTMHVPKAYMTEATPLLKNYLVCPFTNRATTKDLEDPR